MLGLQYRPTATGMIMAGVKYLNAKSEAAKTDNKFNKMGLSLGYQHFFSKRTDAYAVGSYTWADKAADGASTENRTQVMVGLRHRF